MIRKHKDYNFRPIRRLCKVEGCDETATHDKGTVCSKHYQRIKKYGDPHANYSLKQGERPK